MELSKQEQMLALVALKSPEQSVTEFCDAHHISPACFYYWQKKYRQHGTEVPPAEGFAAIGLPALSDTPVATVQLVGGALITLYDVSAFPYVGALL